MTRDFLKVLKQKLDELWIVSPSSSSRWNHFSTTSAVWQSTMSFLKKKIPLLFKKTVATKGYICFHWCWMVSSKVTSIWMKRQYFSAECWPIHDTASIAFFPPPPIMHRLTITWCKCTVTSNLRFINLGNLPLLIQDPFLTIIYPLKIISVMDIGSYAYSKWTVAMQPHMQWGQIYVVVHSFHCLE